MSGEGSFKYYYARARRFRWRIPLLPLVCVFSSLFWNWFAVLFWSRVRRSFSSLLLLLLLLRSNPFFGCEPVPPVDMTR